MTSSELNKIIAVVSPLLGGTGEKGKLTEGVNGEGSLVSAGKGRAWGWGARGGCGVDGSVQEASAESAKR